MIFANPTLLALFTMLRAAPANTPVTVATPPIDLASYGAKWDGRAWAFPPTLDGLVMSVMPVGNGLSGVLQQAGARRTGGAIIGGGGGGPSLSNELPTSVDIADVGAIGLSLQAARADHEHPFPAPRNPENVDRSAAAAGSGTRAAREDHKHDIVVGTPVAVSGPTNGPGSGSQLALANHVHRLAVTVQESGTVVGSRPALNFLNALVSDDAGGERVSVLVTTNPATPLSVSNSDTVVTILTDNDIVSGNFTMPAIGGTGRLLVRFDATASLVLADAQSNGFECHLRVNGVDIVTALNDSTRSARITNGTGGPLTELVPISTQALVTGLPSGAILVELLGRRFTAEGTVTLVGGKTLTAVMV
jgi:hypothetical protein